MQVVTIDSLGENEENRYEEVCDLEHIQGETELAIRVNTNEDEDFPDKDDQWFPKSVVREFDGHVYVAKWFIRKNEIAVRS